ncbi:MAG: hypothetical protein AB4040_16655 [Synechococcus sp.]
MLKNRILLAGLFLFGVSSSIGMGGPHGFGRKAQALEYREIAVGIVPHPSQDDLIILQQGESSGLRLGDRGFITLNGYSVTESAHFESTDIPFTIIELDERSATAQLATPIQPLSSISASILVLDILPTDLQPPNPNLPIASPSGSASTGRQAGFSPMPVSDSNSNAIASSESVATDLSQSTQRLVLNRDWSEPNTTQLCGPEVGGAFFASIPPDLCAQVSREDLLVQALVAGQHPAEVDPADAIGVTALHRGDARLRSVVRFYLRNPDTPRARVALAQEYLRLQHFQQSLAWLADMTDVEFADPRLSDAATHSQMYAAYHTGDYATTIALSSQLVEPTSYQRNLVAAAQYQLKEYDAAIDTLADLPPLTEVLNNHAIVRYQLDRPVLDCDDECSSEEAIAAETQRQYAARPLLEGISKPHPISSYNLAVLNIHQRELSEAMNQFLEIHREITATTPAEPSSTVSPAMLEPPPFDPTLNQLKLELLQYVENHDDSMAYLAQLGWEGGTGLPADLGNVAGIAGSFAGIGSFIPLALFNLASYASAQQQQEAIVDHIQYELTSLYGSDLDLLPIVRPPDPASIDPFASPN